MGVIALRLATTVIVGLTAMAGATICRTVIDIVAIALPLILAADMV